MLENPDWVKEDRRTDMNHFMARLMFRFFAKGADIFHDEGTFSKSVAHHSFLLNTEDTSHDTAEYWRGKLGERKA